VTAQPHGNTRRGGDPVLRAHRCRHLRATPAAHRPSDRRSRRAGVGTSSCRTESSRWRGNGTFRTRSSRLNRSTPSSTWNRPATGGRARSAPPSAGRS
jgi:hypothetical protein